MKRVISGRERPESGVRRSEPEIIHVSLNIPEARRLVLSGLPRERYQGAWEVRCMAERGEDITPIIQAVMNSLRSELKTPTGSMTRVYLAQSLAYCAKDYSIGIAAGIVQSLITDSNMHIRYCGFSIISSMEKKSEETGIFVDSLVRGIGDIAQLVQEISISTLRNYASRGTLEAHAVLMALDGGSAGEASRQNREDVKAHCLCVLEKAPGGI
jgi:hypothetical protein